MMQMETAFAIYIFYHIDSDEYTDEEKAFAIYIVLKMCKELDNDFAPYSKQQLVNVIEYLLKRQWKIVP